jgi:DNA polymerase III alpha subunit (gram-positive type)
MQEYCPRCKKFKSEDQFGHGGSFELECKDCPVEKRELNKAANEILQGYDETNNQI